MKLWLKIFLCTFFLFEIVFNASSLYFIQYNFSQNLQKEIERGISEQHIIYSGMQTNSTYINRTLGYPQSVVHDLLRVTFMQYTQDLDNNGMFIEVLDSRNHPVYTSFTEPLPLSRKELEAPRSDQVDYIIRDIEGTSYLFVTSLLPVSDESYKLTYIRDISEIYLNKKGQISLSMRLNAITTLVLAAGLYLLSRYLTMPIGSLTRSARMMAEGDYSVRAPVISGDEVGILSESFNRMTAAVEEKVLELQHTVENKQRFIESFTHEIKTPLTSIIGYADLLRSAKYDEELFFRGLNYLYSEGKRLESLSLKLMNLILVRGEDLTMQPENIEKLCLEAEKASRPRTESTGITANVSVMPCNLLVERDLLIMLCTNLIDNAVKASREGSVIELRGYLNRENRYVLEVADQGIGIPQEDVKKVFEPFFRVDKSRSRTHGGAGLGLAICAEIAALHQAEIKISSILGSGTIVTVLFPEFATILQQKEDTAISVV